MTDLSALIEDRVLLRIPASDVPHEPGRQLERWVREHGWSIGSTDVTGRRAIMFGEYLVAKWKNLTVQERIMSDAVSIGNCRTGPIVVVRQSPIPPGFAEQIERAGTP